MQHDMSESPATAEALVEFSRLSKLSSTRCQGRSGAIVVSADPLAAVDPAVLGRTGSAGGKFVECIHSLYWTPAPYIDLC